MGRPDTSERATTLHEAGAVLWQAPALMLGAANAMAENVTGFQAKTLWTGAGIVVASIIGFWAHDLREGISNNGAQTAALSQTLNMALAENKQALIEVKAELKQLPQLGAQMGTLEGRLRTIEGMEAGLKAAMDGMQARIDVHRRELDNQRERMDVLTRDFFERGLGVTRPQDQAPPSRR